MQPCSATPAIQEQLPAVVDGISNTHSTSTRPVTARPTHAVTEAAGKRCGCMATWLGKGFSACLRRLSHQPARTEGNSANRKTPLCYRPGRQAVAAAALMHCTAHVAVTHNTTACVVHISCTQSPSSFLSAVHKQRAVQHRHA